MPWNALYPFAWFKLSETTVSNSTVSISGKAFNTPSKAKDPLRYKSQSLSSLRRVDPAPRPKITYAPLVPDVGMTYEFSVIFWQIIFVATGNNPAALRWYCQRIVGNSDAAMELQQSCFDLSSVPYKADVQAFRRDSTSSGPNVSAILFHNAHPSTSKSCLYH